ncbi:putative sensor with HAMP domain containing protein [Actinobacteria bacterium OK074]|nr:putative sensor with HAMP domain containing protein [Actinobacteria bacterium OK074]
MSTNEVDAPDRPAPSPLSGGIRGFADRWPFRRKLNVLVGVPLAVVAILLTYLFAVQIEKSRTADSAARLVRNSVQVAALVDDVENEYQQAMLLSVRQEAAADSGIKPSVTAYQQAQRSVDKQVAKVRDAFGGQLPASEDQALKEVSGLSSLRQTIEQSYLPADNIDPAYTDAAKGLIDGLGLDRNSALAATFTGNLLDSLLHADAAHGSFETSVFSALTGDTNAAIEYNNAVGSYAEYTYQADRFARFATDEQADRLGGIEHGRPEAAIAQDYAELQIEPDQLQATTPAQVRAALDEALTSYPNYRAQAKSRLAVTTSLIGDIADRADAASSDAARRAALLLGITLLGFALWIGFSVTVRRSVVRPVEALTAAAKETSQVTRRELARVADDDAEESGPPRLTEVPIAVRDEIGELAAAFNHVQSTAAALLERQVLSRRNVAEMFGNVGRRVSNLTTRQLALIDAVERGETDPALLERLYSIDHIAVRLRRNADSLMLLAGIRETVLDSGPTALTNVVRAALGQIEGFRRVRLRAATEVMVEPDIIGDLTLMLAELLENAVSFSPAGSPVEVSVRTGRAGALIEISDHGLGMSPEKLDEENARLIRRERLDLVPTKVLGLFVVGTLARRWDVSVALSRTPGGGVTAEVTIPTTLLLAMSPVVEAPPARRDAVGGPLPVRAIEAPDNTAEPFSETSADVTEISRTDPAAPAGSHLPAVSEPVQPAGNEKNAERDAAEAVRPRPSTAAANGTPVLPRRVPRHQSAEPERTAAGPGPQPSAGTRPLVPQPRSAQPEFTAADGDGERTSHSRADSPWSPYTRTGRPDGTTAADAVVRPGESRPLRRRVRGATLHNTAAEAAQQAARQAPRPVDADEVRSALEEFEAAVERAHRDSDTGVVPPSHTSHDQNHLPEGAEQ